MTDRNDPYVSRTSSDWSVVERQESVIWGSVDDGPLDGNQLDFYDQSGFLLLEALFSAEETHELRSQSQRLLAEVDIEREHVIVEPGEHAIRSIFRAHETDETFVRLAADDRLLSVAQQILGSEVYIHHSRINYKPALDGRDFFWHSDFETWHVEDGMPGMRALTAVVMLDDNIEFNGPLLLIPGSHKLFVQCVGETPTEHHRESLRNQRYGVPGPDALAMLIDQGGLLSAKARAGSVLFFDCNTMHASTGNLSPFPRCNAFFVYNSVANGLQAPFGGLPPRPTFLAAREVAPIARDNPVEPS